MKLADEFNYSLYQSVVILALSEVQMKLLIFLEWLIYKVSM
jgi:hypothetical protein